MSGHVVLLTPELEDAYQLIGDHLHLSTEQVLTSLLQIYIEKLALEPPSDIVDDQPIRTYTEWLDNLYEREGEIL